MKKTIRKWNRRHEFQWHKETKTRKGHPSYIIESCGKYNRFFCFTHSPTTEGIENIKLKHNINPRDPEDCYVRPVLQTDKPENFEIPWVKYRLHKDDLLTVKKLFYGNRKRKRR